MRERRATFSHTVPSLKSLCGGGVPSSHPSLGLSVFFLSFFLACLTAWRVSHAERREEREAAGEDDDEEDDTPVVIPSSAVTTYPKGTPVPTPSIKVQVIEERLDLSNNMTGRQMIGVGVRRVVLARGELDKLEGPQYAARRADLRRETQQN